MTIPTIQELIEKYQLLTHPEGGFYRETYRSEATTQTKNGQRNMMTAIYFLLTSENVSRFHVIKSDELWFHHEGNDVTVHVLDEDGYKKLQLGRSHSDSSYQHLVEAGKIFGSTVESQNGYALVSCVVAPGFDFSDFELCDKTSLLKKYPEQHEIIEQLGC